MMIDGGRGKRGKRKEKVSVNIPDSKMVPK